MGTRRTWCVLLLISLAALLAACGAEAWERDPQVQAARRACRQLGKAADYDCVERYAVETLNPDICRLAGIWIDDMCLQAVYEAADDPAICEQLYLGGVRPTCRAYYSQAAALLLRYHDQALGFTAEVPAGWETGDHIATQDALGRWWGSVEFRSGLYPYGHQAFDRYSISVQAAPGLGGTLTETVELSLSPLIPDFRDQVQMRCCLTVGGEQAMELLNYPPTRWGNRQIVILHDGWEYRLNFYPLAGMTTATPAGDEAQVAFDTFLHTFSFLPATPPAPAPTITPVPTPSPSAAAAPTPCPGTEVVISCHAVWPSVDGCGMYGAPLIGGRPAFGDPRSGPDSSRLQRSGVDATRSKRRVRCVSWAASCRSKYCSISAG